MDQFSHDLTVALEETSGFNIKTNKQKNRSFSVGNIHGAPYTTEDSSSSPTVTNNLIHAHKNVDNLDIDISLVLPSDSDEKHNQLFFCKSSKTSNKICALESDSFNETFSPTRFFKPIARKKRKLKRVSAENEDIISSSKTLETALTANKTVESVRKHVLKVEQNRSNIFFSGKRKRSNRDLYNDDEQYKRESSSLPRYNSSNYYSIRPKNYSSTSMGQCDQHLSLSKVSRIEQISQPKDINTAEIKTSGATSMDRTQTGDTNYIMKKKHFFPRNNTNCSCSALHLQNFQFSIEHHLMNCVEAKDFLSSSSLSSSDSDDANEKNDTDHEGDDELTDWPGNESLMSINDIKMDSKRKLTKQRNPLHMKTGQMSASEDALLSLSGACSGLNLNDLKNMHYQKQLSMPNSISCKSFYDDRIKPDTNNKDKVRKIHLGYRRRTSESLSVNTSLNERLVSFIQDPSQLEIRLLPIDIYEYENITSVAELYSLQICFENGYIILTKIRNPVQLTSVQQKGVQGRLFISDFKRRCYEAKGSIVRHK